MGRKKPQTPKDISEYDTGTGTGTALTKTFTSPGTGTITAIRVYFSPGYDLWEI